MATPPDLSITRLYGRDNCIIRERIDSTGGEAIIPPNKQWLEIDMR
jgi:hypothetical protein